MLWSTLVAGQSRLQLSLPKENSPLVVDVIAEVIQHEASNYKGSYYDEKAKYQENFLNKVLISSIKPWLFELSHLKITSSLSDY